MAWSTAPGHITAARAHLVACPAAAAFGLVEAKFHYALAQPNVDDTGTPDALPYCVLADGDPTVTSYAEAGVAGLRGGTILARIYADATPSVLEKLAADISEQIGIVIGLANPSVAYERASERTPAQYAADADNQSPQALVASIVLTISFGLR